jgi:hypothetical protein
LALLLLCNIYFQVPEIWKSPQILIMVANASLTILIELSWTAALLVFIVMYLAFERIAIQFSRPSALGSVSKWKIFFVGASIYIGFFVALHLINVFVRPAATIHDGMNKHSRYSIWQSVWKIDMDFWSIPFLPIYFAVLHMTISDIPKLHLFDLAPVIHMIDGKLAHT